MENQLREVGVYTQPGNPRTQPDPTRNIRVGLGCVGFWVWVGSIFLTRFDLGWVRVPKENDWVNPAQPQNIKKKKAQRPKVKAQSTVCLVSYQSPSPNPNLTLHNPIITSVVKEISLPLYTMCWISVSLCVMCWVLDGINFSFPLCYVLSSWQ